MRLSANFQFLKIRKSHGLLFGVKSKGESISNEPKSIAAKTGRKFSIVPGSSIISSGSSANARFGVINVIDPAKYLMRADENLGLVDSAF